jgi:hypothetical protein
MPVGERPTTFGYHFVFGIQYAPMKGKRRSIAPNATQWPQQQGYFTPSFFCKPDDEVVYWNNSFLSG